MTERFYEGKQKYNKIQIRNIVALNSIKNVLYNNPTRPSYFMHKTTLINA